MSWDGSDELKIVAFDFDGVIFDGESVAVEIGEKFGLGSQIRQTLFELLTWNITLKEAILKGGALWKGIKVDDVAKVSDNLHLRQGTLGTMKELKVHSYKLALISSGLSQVTYNVVKKNLGLDYAFGNEAEIRKGVFTGRLVAPPVDANRKAEILKSIAKSEGLSTRSCAVIGNDPNDIPMMLLAGLRIGINPHPAVAKVSKIVLEKISDLREILPHLVPPEKGLPEDGKNVELNSCSR
ncbi:MAG: HAD-IB family phosphatase [Candidatus Atabeyarchaeum deiterrae]